MDHNSQNRGMNQGILHTLEGYHKNKQNIKSKNKL